MVFARISHCERIFRGSSGGLDGEVSVIERNFISRDGIVTVDAEAAVLHASYCCELLVDGSLGFRNVESKLF